MGFCYSYLNFQHRPKEKERENHCKEGRNVKSIKIKYHYIGSVYMGRNNTITFFFLGRNHMYLSIGGNPVQVLKIP